MRQPNQTLGNKLRMLDHIGGMTNHEEGVIDLHQQAGFALRPAATRTFGRLPVIRCFSIIQSRRR